MMLDLDRNFEKAYFDTGMQRVQRSVALRTILNFVMMPFSGTHIGLFNYLFLR